MNKISIDPVTRLEGHGKIEIFMDEQNDVANVYLQIPELRGFEKFCVGRPVEEVPRIVTRICGVCPLAHHMASAKAVDAVYHVEIPSAARKLRELMYSVYYVYDHTLHFYYLGAPDFVVGPTAPAAKRNVLGVIEKVGLEIGKAVIEHRRLAQDMQILIAGRSTHPVWCIAGGVSKGLKKEDLVPLRENAKKCLEFAKFTLKVFDDVVLKNKAYVDLILSAGYRLEVGDMGLVDADNKVNFYDGLVRVKDAKGREVAKYKAADYVQNVAEHIEPHSYLKYPYLKARGWQGMVEGPESSIYRAIPLSRLNAADGMATPLAQEHYEKMYSVLGGKPAHQTLAIHWARVIELLYAAERWNELLEDPEILSPDVHTLPTEKPTEGVGIVEAPRGTLTHHYATDENGIVVKANLIVGTTNNNAPISMSVKKAAQQVLKGKRDPEEGLLNMVEMAFRAYDPCFSCATHSLPGQMPLEVTVREPDGTVRHHLKRG
ncbi:MAG TPA: Ni/Fe hydrogenase subunit alpha [Myxococcota bacterium]|nr:Ni/Fe hydrogenase subunit alpha [Myxococcota bacterium]HRY95620.1 Ni/Fe hydrogenase subunit alpha [Myxococcota bacterium]HSA20122.1 Ni/Fe hydrogenase subunit alpha [Myxococcota bacterium]